MKEKEPVLYQLSSDSRCYNCDRKLLINEIVKLKNQEDEKEVFCLSCAGLNHLELLGGGNAKLTRLAKKYSKEKYVVVRWSQLWKCYERKGLLLEKAAIRKAEAENP